MNAGRGKPEHGISGSYIGSRQQRAPFGGTDRKARQIVIALLVEAGHLGGLAPDQRAAGFPAALGDPRDDRGGRLRIELAAGEVVQEEQRFCTLHHEVVDRHRHEVNPDTAMQAGLDRNLDLGANAIGRGDQNRILEAGRLQVEQSAETADFGLSAGSRRGADHRLDEIDQAIAGVDIDARIRISQPVPALGHGLFQMLVRWGYVGFRLCAMARNEYGHILCRQEPVHPRNGRDLSSHQAGNPEATELSIPNIITLGRIILVPIIVWAIASSQMEIALAIFLIAGISDAVDGFLAKRFNMASELGALLDPLADKALLVSIYVALGIWGAVPRWIVILVVSRDIMIVSAVIVSWLFGKPIPMKPLMVSKLNTAAQVAFAALVLASLSFGFTPAPYDLILMFLVTVFTLVSVSLYLVEWVRHMSTIEAR